MSLQQPEVIKKSVPVLVEGVFIIIIGFVIVANTTTTDIIFHDNYVLPAIETCFPENQEEFCQNIRQRMGLPSNAQLEIGDIYFIEIARQAVFIGVILFLIRLAIGYFLQIQGVRKVRLTTFLMAFFWGLVGSTLFIFGFVDTLYYVFQDKDLPNELPHLNNAGIFQETRSFTGNPNIVEIEDLLLTNALGVIIIVSFLIVMMFVFANNHLAKRGIA